jgi:hypothetical protein
MASFCPNHNVSEQTDNGGYAISIQSALPTGPTVVKCHPLSPIRQLVEEHT